MARRRARALVIVEEFAPDPARCAQALIKLLLYTPPTDVPETAQDVACGEAPREAQAESDETR